MTVDEGVEREKDEKENEELEIKTAIDVLDSQGGIMIEEPPEGCNTPPGIKDDTEKLRGENPGGGAYQEPHLGSIAHHNDGLLTIIPETEITLDLNSSDIIEEDLDLIIDMKNLKSQGFCDFCALEMCLCDLTKLDMKIAQLKDEEAKRIKADEVFEVIEIFDDSTPLHQAESHGEGNLESLGDLKPTKPLLMLMKKEFLLLLDSLKTYLHF